MRRTLVIGFGLAMIAVALIQPTPAVAQIATIIETQVPERPIPPPPEVRGREHRAKTNPYFGLRSSFQNVWTYGGIACGGESRAWKGGLHLHSIDEKFQKLLRK